MENHDRTCEGTEVFDPMYGLLAQMPARMVGPVEVSGNLEACKKIIRVFARFENSNSTAGIIFPWLRPFTSAYAIRLVLGTVGGRLDLCRLHTLPAESQLKRPCY
ncbi:hypothetical protein QBC44DRAFT_375767 [Cladorrhinum sp. PSN332]|nr:hypothetical protein QBC44DRAFT_375767 [Cladorrhinum sp. PSN332]